MSFEVNGQMIIGAAKAGVTFAEHFAAIIAAVESARRAPLLEIAATKLRDSLATVTGEMRSAGATDRDVKEFCDAATYAFADKITELTD